MVAPTAPAVDGAGAAPNRRDGRGRFAEGNRLGRGNPMARRVARLRAALLRSVTADDIETVVRALIERARSGDVAAARELLDRCLGKGEGVDLLVRLEAVEDVQAATGATRGLAGGSRSPNRSARREYERPTGQAGAVAERGGTARRLPSLRLAVARRPGFHGARRRLGPCAVPDLRESGQCRRVDAARPLRRWRDTPQGTGPLRGLTPGARGGRPVNRLVPGDDSSTDGASVGIAGSPPGLPVVA